MADTAAKRVVAQRIQTERLILVPLAPAHAEELATALADPQLHEFIGGAPLDANALMGQIERWAAGCPDERQGWLNWAIQLRDGGALVGTLQATVRNAGDGLVADVAWVLGVPWQGHGLASEAARGLVSWLGEAGVRCVFAHIHPDHHESERVAMAAGLVPTADEVEGERVWRLQS